MRKRSETLHGVGSPDQRQKDSFKQVLLPLLRTPLAVPPPPAPPPDPGWSLGDWASFLVGIIVGATVGVGVTLWIWRALEP